MAAQILGLSSDGPTKAEGQGSLPKHMSRKTQIATNLFKS